MRLTPQRSRRGLAPGAAAAVLALAVTGCAAGNEAGAADSDLSGTLGGAGASSQEAAQAAWRAGFQEANPDVTVNYNPVGSGGGRERFLDGGVVYAGTDSYLDDDELEAATERCEGTEPIEVPAYISPIALVYNLEDVDELNLSAEAITGIFEGDITTWDDPAIAADNDGVDLPSTAITPVHRGDDSGTTENFTEYLAAAGGWSAEPSDVWPVTGGEAATGTSGVIDTVSGNDGYIGYADASAAAELSVANVAVGDDYVEPSADAAANIVGASPRVEGRPETDMAVDIDHETTEAGTYPIVLASYLLACTEYEDAEDAELAKGFLTYVLSTEGQELAAENAGSAPLAPEVADEANGIVEQIQTD